MAPITQKRIPPRAPSATRAVCALIAAAGLLTLAACANPGGSSPATGAQVERYDVGAIRTVQRRLNALGYSAGPVDGAYGQQTRRGIQAFQRARGLEPTGVPTERLLAALERAPASDTSRTAWAAPTPTPPSQPSIPQIAHAPKAEETSGPMGAPQRLRTGDSRVGSADPGSNAAPTAGDAARTAARTATGTTTGLAGQAPDGDTSAPTGGELGSADDSVADDGAAGELESQQGSAAADPPPSLSEMDLVGTRWRVEGELNRPIEITLQANGDVDAPVGEWSWQRQDREIELSFDSGTRSRSTRTGELVARDRIEGTARDTYGRSWRWHASRVQLSAANR